MSRVVTVAATQMACSWDRQANIANADRLVREALDAGYPTLIAGGGDGTLHEVAAAMLEIQANASLALLPLGSANEDRKSVV